MATHPDGRSTVHILHDNPDWIPPFTAALDAAGVPYHEWDVRSGSIDLGAEPPEGVFWSRLSASAHTRGTPHAKEHARAVLRWAEAAGRTVVNGSRVLELEVSKVAQHTALAAAGFDVPRTLAAFDLESAKHRARELPAPFITKHNQGGKGLGVRRFDSHEEFDAAIDAGTLDEPADGILLLQEYLVSAEPFITRAEFVGGELVYAVRVDTSTGSFELCPADACVVPGADGADAAATSPPFVRDHRIDPRDPFVLALGAFLREAGIEIAGVEFIVTADGRRVPYDINTNTNYNPDVEADGGVSAAAEVAALLAARLTEVAAVGATR